MTGNVKYSLNRKCEKLEMVAKIHRGMSEMLIRIISLKKLHDKNVNQKLSLDCLASRKNSD